ncbi:kinase/pyrophosphorylase [Paenibacillus albiflavus]|uniref:Putative pyruvate, phosphate dikinase regulatory protein n=1 Tax=Paenibacillus albiflavus TaxID=2545760 RepID=A0A4V2WP34_9BACL|nr:pyruvate, water dikinase regulatory protein [Paenibacillus albiflavus]TCZ77812.1 kinase/pyrophosphorylase [Paenibacillus albiflavus]
MLEEDHISLITICSDSVGETAESVVRAAIRQFEQCDVRLRRVRQVRKVEEIKELIADTAEHRGIIVYTLVQAELRSVMKTESKKYGIRAVDIMGPMMEALVELLEESPRRKPGLLHQLDENYFRRVEAIEFTVRCDDGRESHLMLEADIVLLGVSRTSKTPLSIYLAHKGYKVANFPLVPELKPPQELFQIPPSRIIGMTMDPSQMYKIRTQRLQTLGLSADSQYATMNRIEEELAFARQLYEQLDCPIIDVTDKAIEETAGIILGYNE